MKKEIWIYYKDKWVKNPSKLIMFAYKIQQFFRRWKIVDTWKYKTILRSDMDRYFVLSPKEREKADELYKLKGTLSYEFYPCGVGWGIQVRVKRTNEIIDITDYDCW